MSVIDNFAKVLEKIIKIRLETFLKNITWCQKSNNSASKVTNQLKILYPSIAVFPDFEKVFDTANH